MTHLDGSSCITTAYSNSGHGPALGFVYSVEPFGMPSSDEAGGSKRLADFMTACRNLKDWRGGSVVYPTTSGLGGGYTFFEKTKADFVDEAMTKGDEIIVVQGCFAYRTLGLPRHSYFCYFYKQGFSKIQNLNICTSGHDAD